MSGRYCAIVFQGSGGAKTGIHPSQSGKWKMDVGKQPDRIPLSSVRYDELGEQNGSLTHTWIRLFRVTGALEVGDNTNPGGEML